MALSMLYVWSFDDALKDKNLIHRHQPTRNLINKAVPNWNWRLNREEMDGHRLCYSYNFADIYFGDSCKQL